MKKWIAALLLAVLPALSMAYGPQPWQPDSKGWPQAAPGNVIQCAPGYTATTVETCLNQWAVALFDGTVTMAGFQQTTGYYPASNTVTFATSPGYESYNTGTTYYQSINAACLVGANNAVASGLIAPFNSSATGTCISDNSIGLCGIYNCVQYRNNVPTTGQISAAQVWQCPSGTLISSNSSHTAYICSGPPLVCPAGDGGPDSLGRCTHVCKVRGFGIVNMEWHTNGDIYVYLDNIHINDAAHGCVDPNPLPTWYGKIGSATHPPVCPLSSMTLSTFTPTAASSYYCPCTNSKLIFDGNACDSPWDLGNASPFGVAGTAYAQSGNVINESESVTIPFTSFPGDTSTTVYTITIQGAIDYTANGGNTVNTSSLQYSPSFVDVNGNGSNVFSNLTWNHSTVNGIDTWTGSGSGVVPGTIYGMWLIPQVVSTGASDPNPETAPLVYVSITDGKPVAGVVQSTSNTQGGQATDPITSSTGDSFVAYVFGGNGVAGEVTDNLGNTYTLLTHLTFPGGRAEDVFTCLKCTGGANHVFSTSAGFYIIVADVKGVSAIDSFVTGKSGNCGSVAMGPLTVNAAGEIEIVGVYDMDTNGASTGFNAPYSFVSSIDGLGAGSGVGVGQLAWRSTVSAGTESYTWVDRNQSCNIVAVDVLLKP